ncbi:DUF4352 domain-containing protein [Occultella glacieicola]|uniref:DUF4352 domain-containing protein n=1 Tax=Occultella glacieicola TaxID=2518684 RepID=A0ABY2E5I0_9MICO|nr:DUF4352 domain-containing protein [Occultella glacieicola]TDE95063.1 DUF4352 domain-containing protein [Occultella glacieicola]
MSTNDHGGQTPPQQPYAPQGAVHYSTPDGGAQPGGYGPAGQGPGGYGPVGPGGYGSGAPVPPPVEPTKRSWFARHKILTGIGAVVLLGIVIGAVNGGGDTSGGATDTGAPTTQAPTADEADAAAAEPAEPAGDATEPAAPAATEPAAVEPAVEAAPGIGTAVRDGKFEFVVTGIEAGVSEVGSEYFNEQAQGQFVLVHLTVTNIGEAPQYFSDSDQQMFDAAGREFAANSAAGIWIEGNDTFFTEINPGNTVEGTIVFDIPADAVPTTLELHDSFLSGGVEVALG